MLVGAGLAPPPARDRLSCQGRAKARPYRVPVTDPHDAATAEGAG